MRSTVLRFHLTTLCAISLITLVNTNLAQAQYNAPRDIYANDGTYLGNTNPNRFDANSIYNPYGQYGSKYAPNSVNNDYGPYGNRYSSTSPNNPYTNPGSSVTQDGYGTRTPYGGWSKKGPSGY